MQETSGPDFFQMSPRDDPDTKHIPQGKGTRLPGAVGRNGKDSSIAGLDAVSHKDSVSREEKIRLGRQATCMGVPFSDVWEDTENGAKLIAERVALKMPAASHPSIVQ